MPENMAQLVIVAKPKRTTDFGTDDSELQCSLIVTRPNSRIVFCDFVVDASLT
jgi:hypothetical protein